VIIENDELLGLGQGARAHLEGGESADGNRAVEGPLHVLGGDRRAVVESGVLLELESHRHVADVHVVGKLHLELVALVVLHPVGERLHLVADQPVVAIPGDFVARHIGAHAVNVDIVGAALGHDEERFLTRLCLGRRPDCRRRREHARPRERSHGLQEFATLHR